MPKDTDPGLRMMSLQRRALAAQRGELSPAPAPEQAPAPGMSLQERAIAAQRGELAVQAPESAPPAPRESIQARAARLQGGQTAASQPPAPAPAQTQAPAPAQAQPPAARPPAAKPLTVPKASTINQAARLIDTRTLPMATIDAYRRMKGVNEVPRFISSVELASLPPA